MNKIRGNKLSSTLRLKKFGGFRVSQLEKEVEWTLKYLDRSNIAIAWTYYKIYKNRFKSQQRIKIETSICFKIISLDFNIANFKSNQLRREKAKKVTNSSWTRDSYISLHSRY